MTIKPSQPPSAWDAYGTVMSLLTDGFAFLGALLAYFLLAWDWGVRTVHDPSSGPAPMYHTEVTNILGTPVWSTWAAITLGASLGGLLTWVFHALNLVKPLLPQLRTITKKS